MVTRIRIGNSESSPNQGGFTLFGKGFGNYQMGLILRLKHEPIENERPEVAKRRSKKS